MKQRLKLEELKVKSFITESGSREKVLGGSPQLGPLMLDNNTNVSRYGLVLTSFVQTRKKNIIRSRG